MSKPVVGILMGSDSDLPVMQEAAAMLQEFGIEYEMTIASAHRTPKKVLEYSTSAETRGIKVIIAGAGWAAHLAGVIASQTTLPVIGVPIDSSPLEGIDALLSTVADAGRGPGGDHVARQGRREKRRDLCRPDHRGERREDGEPAQGLPGGNGARRGRKGKAARDDYRPSRGAPGAGCRGGAETPAKKKPRRRRRKKKTGGPAPAPGQTA